MTVVMKFLDILVTILHWMVAIPLAGFAGFFLVGVAIKIYLHINDEVDFSWLLRVGSIQRKEYQLNVKDKALDERESELKKQKTDAKNESKQAIRDIAKAKADSKKYIDYLNALLNASDLTDAIQKPIYKETVSFIKRNSKKDAFVGNLYGYLDYLELKDNKTSMDTIGDVISSMRFWLNNEFQGKEAHEFVIIVYNGLINLGCHPLVAACRLYRDYADHPNIM